ncbi:MAG TPA: cupin domain-containing protein [Spirochaetota bacterium]|nr:cupin domain-containing protein [Spirochaetota bacterium]
MEKDIRGTVINTGNFIEYQAGSVVSKEIIRKETGTVTIFAFDKGEGLSEHTAPFDALVQVIDGEAEIIIAGTKNRLVKGEMIIMPANQTHALNAVERFKMILTMIRSKIPSVVLNK